MKTMQIEWLKFKKYPHIGKPLVSSKDRVWVENYVIDSQNIVRHKFGLSLKPWGIALKFLFLHHENILFPND